MLGWGTQPTSSNDNSSLMISNLDGSNEQTLLTTDSGSSSPTQLVTELWSANGQSLYFSKEPIGLGGYIIFNGASNLYKIDIHTKTVTEVIQQSPTSSPQDCLDAISNDYRFIADHCLPDVITIRNLQNGQTDSIQAPPEVIGYRLLGSARFSPTGDRIAFALAQSNAANERGWVAVGDSSGGVSKLVSASDIGSYFTVQGWLDDQTLLVQSTSIECNPKCESELFTVGVDGSDFTKVADGKLLTVIDNR